MVCHSVQPGEHQTGPSLTHVWNRKAGTTPGVGKCSAAEFYCFSNSSGTHMRTLDAVRWLFRSARRFGAAGARPA